MHTDSVCFLVYLYTFTFIVGFLIWLFSVLVAGPEPSKKEPPHYGSSALAWGFMFEAVSQSAKTPKPGPKLKALT